MQHAAIKHPPSPEVVAGCTWFQNLNDITYLLSELGDRTQSWCFTQEFMSDPTARSVLDFVFWILCLLCLDTCYLRRNRTVGTLLESVTVKLINHIWCRATLFFIMLLFHKTRTLFVFAHRDCPTIHRVVVYEDTSPIQSRTPCRLLASMTRCGTVVGRKDWIVTVHWLDLY